MPLLHYDSLESIPTELREHARPGDDGRLTVNVIPSSKVDEFRDKNIALLKQVDEYAAKFAPMHEVVGDNLDEFKKTLEELKLTDQRVKDGTYKESRAVEEAVGKRTEDMRKAYEERVQKEVRDAASWRDKATSAEQRFKQSVIAAAIKDACIEPDSGVDPRAISKIVRDGLEVFRLGDDGKLQAFEGNSNMMLYGTDGTASLTPKEWLAKEKVTSPYFFKQTGGGGADGNGGKGELVMGQDRNTLKTLLKTKGGAGLLELANDQAAKKRAS